MGLTRGWWRASLGSNGQGVLIKRTRRDLLLLVWAVVAVTASAELSNGKAQAATLSADIPIGSGAANTVHCLYGGADDRRSRSA